MKHLLSNGMLAGCVLAALAVQPVAAAKAPVPDKVCLSLREIGSSKPDKAGNSILFKMRDGRAWRNDLQTPCPDLGFNGFAWVMHGPDQVCDDEQSIRVLRSGEVCHLGKFTQMTPVPKS